MAHASLTSNKLITLRNVMCYSNIFKRGEDIYPLRILAGGETIFNYP